MYTYDNIAMLGYIFVNVVNDSLCGLLAYLCRKRDSDSVFDMYGTQFRQNLLYSIASI